MATAALIIGALKYGVPAVASVIGAFHAWRANRRLAKAEKAETVTH